jgi:hypothetical protein
MLEADNYDTARTRLRNAVQHIILACDTNATLLWEISYSSQSPTVDSSLHQASFTTDLSGRILAFQPFPEDIAFDDRLLDSIKAIWATIMGPSAEDLEFMRFEERSGEEAEE